MFSRYSRLAALCAVVMMASLAGTAGAVAQTYPSQPIKVVIGFGPGSAADILARLVGKQMEVSLGQPIVVENRLGNSSMIAAESVARAAPDGYTLFMATIANTLNPAETKSSFNLGKALAPIALLGIVPNVLVANPSVPANNLQELIALAKSKPESLSFGSSGYATASYMAGELFNAKAGTKILAVPYQGGSSQAVSDLLSGRITLMFNVAATLAPHVEAGRLKAFAVAQSKRASIMPDVPTLTEAGMAGFDAGVWIGLLAPAGTPPAIIDKLSAAANAALNTDQVQSALKQQGTDPVGGTPKEFADFIQADIEKWTAVLASSSARK
ncbi:Bug family tripartite tricarboxylate transporter substrate binding protein [Bradyrhizobium erythrophlei]|uniref:Tripartite-type tricarboxylate transporter, receptor component TctC n=1 Tax=Bradyrhizobium erythrophlei TaxID=1437360 RepID=A0A1M5VY19_9BRAD|nr:tripartite tricarboxylate transporter substrate binding protein [Bradyrhizobium erythrophlei]SHH80070.1 Tripartite-type tricarboxylate transporter, receptor component TctC [Bradyrhizobium erythrophlei]